MDAVQKTVVMDAGGIVIGKSVFGGPDFFRSAFLDLEQDGAGVITGGKEDQITNHQGRSGGDGSLHGRTKLPFEENFSGHGIRCDQARAGEKESVTTAIYRRGNGRGIARFGVGGLPEDFSTGAIEGNNSCAIAATNIEKNGTAFDQRRTGDAEEAFRRR